MEALLNPQRETFRWWSRQWPAVSALEEHAARLDPTIERLPHSLLRDHPALRTYVARWQVPLWDVWGYLAPAEGPWALRRMVVLFPKGLAGPVMLCLDGPRDSLHRNGLDGKSIELCLYYSLDPAEYRWKPSDGLVRLFDLGRRHLYCEHIWRRDGRRDRDWPVKDAPHGYAGAPAAPNPSLLLPPELPIGDDGTFLGPMRP